MKELRTVRTGRLSHARRAPVAVRGVVVCAMVVGGAGKAVADIVSTFDTGDEGWLIFGDAQGSSVTPSWSPTGGNPGGHIFAVDNVAGGVWYFQAPEKFLGDRTDSYDQMLSFDLMQQISGSPNPFTAPDVMLIGGGLTLTFNFFNHPAFGEWTSYSVHLHESAGWLNQSTGDAATQSELLTTLGSLGALRIRGEYQVGPDTGFLDNVVLGQIPAPGTLALLGIAIVSCGCRRRSA